MNFKFNQKLFFNLTSKKLEFECAIVVGVTLIKYAYIKFNEPDNVEYRYILMSTKTKKLHVMSLSLLEDLIMISDDEKIYENLTTQEASDYEIIVNSIRKKRTKSK